MSAAVSLTASTLPPPAEAGSLEAVLLALLERSTTEANAVALLREAYEEIDRLNAELARLRGTR